MKRSEHWEGIPGWMLDDPTSPDGKRWIATGYGWDKIIARVKADANYRCQLNISEHCQGTSQWLDVHHRRGRGGGKRDDRIYIVGKMNLLACCRNCHQIARIETKEEVYGDTAKTYPRPTDRKRLSRWDSGKTEEVS